MNSFFKQSIAALVISLSLATAATAQELTPAGSGSSLATQTPVLIAQSGGDRFMTVDPANKLYNLMVIDAMIQKMVEQAQVGAMGMQSKDPAMRAMSMQMLKDSNAELQKLMKMREDFFADSTNFRN